VTRRPRQSSAVKILGRNLLGILFKVNCGNESSKSSEQMMAQLNMLLVNFRNFRVLCFTKLSGNGILLKCVSSEKYEEAKACLYCGPMTW
jgi:hypothetical protein